MFSGHCAQFGSADVGPRQEIVDLAVWVAVDDPGEDVGEIVEQLDTVEMGWLPPSPDGIAMCQKVAAIRAADRNP